MSIVTSISAALDTLSIPALDLPPLSPAAIAAGTAGAIILGGSYLLLTNLYDINQPKEFRNIPQLNSWQQIYYQLAKRTFNQRYDDTMKAIQEKYGISRVKQLGQTTIYISSPEYAKEVLTHTDTYSKILPTSVIPESVGARWIGVNLVFSNGDVWRRHRRVSNPAFHRSWSTSIFGECGECLMKQMDKLMQNGTGTFTPYDFMQRMTLDALGKAIFDYEFNALENPGGEYVTKYHHIRENTFNPYYLLAPWLDTIPIFRRTKLFKAIDDFDAMILRIIESKREKIRANAGKNLDSASKDLLTLMIEANEGEEALTDEELRANIVILFIAGHDTTANALTSTLYYIAKLPDLQKRLHDEVTSVLGPSTAANGTPIPTLEQTKQFDLINAVMKEAMRINSSVKLLPGRTVTTPTPIGPYVIPPGASVEVNIHSIHHNSKYWDEPEEFRPERFLDASADADAAGGKAQALSWVPFSYGTRACIGMNFSIIEQRVILAMLIHRYQFSLPPDSKHKEAIVFKGNGVNAKAQDLDINFTSRY